MLYKELIFFWQVFTYQRKKFVYQIILLQQYYIDTTVKSRWYATKLLMEGFADRDDG